MNIQESIQEKLAEMIKVDRTTAARAIKKLEVNGFIEKKEDKHNKKIKKLFPTEKGKNVSPFNKKRKRLFQYRCIRGIFRKRSRNDFQSASKKKYRKRLGICKKKGNRRNY